MTYILVHLQISVVIGRPRLRNEPLARAEVALMASIFFFAVLGNVAVLVMLRCLSRVKSLGRMYTMIGHLSCADLFVAIFNLLPQLIWDATYRFHGGRVVCKLVKYGQVGRTCPGGVGTNIESSDT